MFTQQSLLEELSRLGTEQTVKTYTRHGIQGPMYGVSYANLGKLKKQIKKNHELALGLWASGNHDAKVLATMIADPKQVTDELLETWVQQSGNTAMTDALTKLIIQTPFVQTKADLWSQSGDEWISTAGWGLVGIIAMEKPEIPDSYFEPYLRQIETSIHQQKNRVRYAMNNALIAIGTRNAELYQEAFRIGKAIGKVYVDHGDTNCKTPDACVYLEKSLAGLNPINRRRSSLIGN